VIIKNSEPDSDLITGFFQAYERRAPLPATLRAS